MSNTLDQIIREQQQREVPSLVDLCIDVIHKNLDRLESLQYVDEELVLRILEPMKPDRLMEIERINEEQGCHLETDELWRMHCKRDFGCKDGDLERYNVDSWAALWKKKKAEKKEVLERAAKKLKKQYAEIQKEKSQQKIKLVSPTETRRPSSSRLFTGSRMSMGSRMSVQTRPNASRASSFVKPAKKSKIWQASKKETSALSRSIAPMKSFSSEIRSSSTRTTTRKKVLYQPSTITQQPRKLVINTTESSIDFTKNRPPSPNHFDDFVSPVDVGPIFADEKKKGPKSSRMKKIVGEHNKRMMRFSNTTESPPKKQKIEPKKKKTSSIDFKNLRETPNVNVFALSIPKKKK